MESLDMKPIVILLGLVIIAYSIYLILEPRKVVNTIKSLVETYQLQFLACFIALLAVLFLISAPALRYPWVLWVVGMLSAIEALVAFTNPKQIYSQMLDWYLSQVSDQANRCFGIIGVIFGTLVLAWIK
jgi:uncharacterized protein YjeT (DUF2065 family)